MARGMWSGRPLGTFGAIAVLALAVSACSVGGLKPAPGGATAALASFAPAKSSAGQMPSASAVPAAPSAMGYSGAGQYDTLIAYYATQYKVPEALVRRVIKKESGYNAGARNGPYYGLMQISHATAKGMGYGGSPAGLLDAETNLRYAVRYLAGAYVTAKGNEGQAMRFYASGYYYDAKRLGLLEASGLR